MFRAPLAPKNVDSSTKSTTKSKKVRSLTPHLDRQTTLEILRKVNDCASPNVQIRITEEDLTKPMVRDMAVCMPVFDDLIVGRTCYSYLFDDS